MKKFLLSSVISFLVLSLSLHAQTSTTKEYGTVKDAIKQSNTLFGEAFVKGDSAAMVALYHSEAKIFPPSLKAMNQRTEMGHLITAIPSSGIKAVTLTSTEVLAAGDMAIETGVYEMSDGTSTIETGKYMVVWKKENGKYKMFRDIWNSDPAATH